MANEELKRCYCGSGRREVIDYGYGPNPERIVCVDCGFSADIENWNTREPTMEEMLVELGGNDGWAWSSEVGLLLVDLTLYPEEYPTPREAVKAAWEAMRKEKS